MRHLLTLTLIFPLVISLHAQEFHFGLRGGVTYGGLIGDEESIESNEFGTGFTFGIHAAYDITPVFGIKSGLEYLQLNYDQDINGASNFNFLRVDDTRTIVNGQRDQNLNFTRSFLYLPVSVYGIFWEKLELYGGVQVGYNVSSRAGGEVRFSASGIPEFTAELDHNYFDNEARQFFSTDDPRTFSSIIVHEDLGAYYEFDNVENDLFNRLDLGLHAGASVFLSSTLYLGTKVMYGLTDQTEQEVDRSYSPVALGQGLPTRDDTDNSFILEAMLGFRF